VKMSAKFISAQYFEGRKETADEMGRLPYYEIRWSEVNVPKAGPGKGHSCSSENMVAIPADVVNEFLYEIVDGEGSHD
jgi:hypothetical protein